MCENTLKGYFVTWTASFSRVTRAPPSLVSRKMTLSEIFKSALHWFLLFPKILTSKSREDSHLLLSDSEAPGLIYRGTVGFLQLWAQFMSTMRLIHIYEEHRRSCTANNERTAVIQSYLISCCCKACVRVFLHARHIFFFVSAWIEWLSVL